MKQDTKTQQTDSPDFINDDNYPKTGFKVTLINKAEYKGNTYSWSSNAKGWLKDTPEQPEPENKNPDVSVEGLNVEMANCLEWFVKHCEQYFPLFPLADSQESEMLTKAKAILQSIAGM